MTPTNEQELDPIINIMDMWDFAPLQDEDIRRERVYKEIQAHTNAEIAKVLDRLKKRSDGLPCTVRYSDGSVERMRVVPLSAIEAEQAKLKEVK